MKTWKVEAAIIAVGMVLLGVIIKWGINDFIDKERIVSVKGLAEMEVQYNLALRQRRWMDYDDQMIYAKTILENYPDILAHFQDAFPYICVDEAQVIHIDQVDEHKMQQEWHGLH